MTADAQPYITNPPSKHIFKKASEPQEVDGLFDVTAADKQP